MSVFNFLSADPWQDWLKDIRDKFAMSVFNFFSADPWQDWLEDIRAKSWVDCNGNYINWAYVCRICHANSFHFIKDDKNTNWFCCDEYGDINTLLFIKLEDLFCHMQNILKYPYEFNDGNHSTINMLDWMSDDVGSLYEGEMKDKMASALCYIFDCSSVFEVWRRVYGYVYWPWLKVFEKLSSQECEVVTKENVNLFENSYKIAKRVCHMNTDLCRAIEEKIATVRKPDPMETPPDTGGNPYNADMLRRHNYFIAHWKFS
ncbi:MAG: hypothetical protein LBB20_03035 [Puniceicoccales bacterium]|nr:hypothetical protein [Puniceicoccales bacterium]